MTEAQEIERATALARESHLWDTFYRPPRRYRVYATQIHLETGCVAVLVEVRVYHRSARWLLTEEEHAQLCLTQ